MANSSNSLMNPAQRQAVHYIDGPLLVLAGAGSGKTRVITEKIAYLITRCGIPARAIVAVTFTNKAAREMQQRVARLVSGQASRGLAISTFHALGVRFLRQELQAAGLREGFSILDQQDAQLLLRDLQRRHGLQEDADRARATLATISAWKNAMLDPARALAGVEDDWQQECALLYRDYRQCLAAYNAVDLDDLLLRPVQLLEQDGQLRERWQMRVRYLLVDEYQDTNSCQYQLLRLLTQPQARFTVVGDDDQSIYAWRGARPENLRQLQQDFPALRVIKLEQNYRSSGNILKAANALIAHNPHLFSKSLWSAHGPGDPLRVMVCRNERHEAERVASEILHLRFTRQARFADFAVLYRGNHQARLLETALREFSVPYQMTGGTAFFARGEVKDLVAYLRLLVNPDDDTAFLRVINVPRREIGPTTLERLGNYAHQRGCSLFSACRELGLVAELGERARARLGQFVDWAGRRAMTLADERPGALLDQIMADVGYREWLRQTSSSDAMAKRRLQTVNDLKDWLNRVAEQPEIKDLQGLLTRLMLMDLLDRREEDKADVDQVRLMTLHAAKGLEFPFVFMIGVEEELLPHLGAIEEGTVEEERRLAYVGITRAQRHLVMTLARTRKRAGEVCGCRPSRFLDELPDDLLAWEGQGRAVDPAESRSRGKAHLSGLKELLGR